MRLLDTNVWLYAVNESAPQHRAAVSALENAFGQRHGVVVAWNALLGFLRLSTQRGVLPTPLPIESALLTVHDWLTHPAATIVHPGPQHGALLARLLLGAGQGGNLTNDAHLAALAIEHGATLVSFDRDFERFAGLRFERLQA